MAPLELSAECDELYSTLLTAATESEEGLKKQFFQKDVAEVAKKTAKSVAELLKVIQELQNHALLRASRWQGSLCWSTRPRAAAEHIRVLNTNERTLYEYVEDAHTKGIWLKDLKKRSGIEDGKVQKAMSKLEGARLVKVIKNVRAPAQKTYMLFHLVPSDDVTGGSFFDAGDLDEVLIEEVANLIVFHVKMASWEESKVRQPRRGRSPVDVDHQEDDAVAGAETNGKKRKRTADIEDSVPARKHRSRDYEDIVVQLAWPAGTREYPTANGIHNFVTTMDAIRASKAQQLTVAEIQGVIDMLVWDDKLEKVGSGYRTVRGVSFRPPGAVAEDEDDEDLEKVGNGLTQTPCAKCPVFDLCGEGGPVSARNCEYFAEWLNHGT
ncbi:34-kDa subunit of RNA polymerase III (C) [Elasticomyces elasticus]|nr:34-kDa subunit of RNA polymerase III (C) [Elasticomyces elasticus]